MTWEDPKKPPKEKKAEEVKMPTPNPDDGAGKDKKPVDVKAE